MSGYIQLVRDSQDLDDMLANGYHNEFILLTVIARRARWKESRTSNTKVGEARIGDHEKYGMTRQQYRTAKKNLEKWGFVTITSTKAGTVAKLVDTTVYNINADVVNHDINQELTISQPSANHQPTTKEKVIKGKKGNTPPKSPQGVVVGFDEFWSEYPRKVAKQNAIKAFKKVNPDRELLAKIISDVQCRSKSEEWTKASGQYIPHPATYLNQQRWEDEDAQKPAITQQILELCEAASYGHDWADKILRKRGIDWRSHWEVRQ